MRSLWRDGQRSRASVKPRRKLPADRVAEPASFLKVLSGLLLLSRAYVDDGQIGVRVDVFRISLDGLLIGPPGFVRIPSGRQGVSQDVIDHRVAPAQFNPSLQGGKGPREPPHLN